ncbi:unnamed protein product, partial [Heligmosomoides polygyrus]|uniref:ZP domain-containing protein n=1 Tax=Heligmosomoides polygyrus TaxID=6339 RepID=A0A183GBJ0_HELPZ
LFEYLFITSFLAGFLVIIASDAVRCQSCFNYNGLACVSNPDCYGDFCLFEQIIRLDGVMSVRKACSAVGQYQFDDGTIITNLNQCVTRSSPVGQYYVLLCSSGDACNSQCITTAPPTPQPPYPGTGQGFFRYQRRISNNQLMMKKSCSDIPTVLLDDGTAVNAVGVCEIRNTVTSRYFVKICDDANFCNNYCNPEVTTEPQRQPTVSCYECESYGSDCFTGQCAAQYCLYGRESHIEVSLHLHQRD